jgi:hypothetical protein
MVAEPEVLSRMSRDECITAAALALADGYARQALLTPRQAAQDANPPGGPSVDELELRIRARRARHAQTAAEPPSPPAARRPTVNDLGLLRPNGGAR